MTEAMNEQNEFQAALDAYQVAMGDRQIALAYVTHYEAIRKSLEFMAANHEAVRDGIYREFLDIANNETDPWHRTELRNSCGEVKIAIARAAEKLSQGD